MLGCDDTVLLNEDACLTEVEVVGSFESRGLAKGTYHSSSH